MRRILTVILAVSFVLSGCSNPKPTYEGDAGTNDNQNNNVSDPDPDPNPDSGYECTVVLKSSKQIAVWLETDDGWFELGPVSTLTDCPTGPKFTLEFNPTGVFVVSALDDLEFTSTCFVDMRKINEDPAAPFNFWEFSSTIKSFWTLPSYWVYDLFPDNYATAEGFELSASAFICALKLDMLNLGCDGEVDDLFFISEGSVVHDKYYEGEWMPILRFGVIKRE